MNVYDWKKKILWSLLDKQNHRNPNPSQDEENRAKSHRHQEECLECEGGWTSHEEESDNVSNKKGFKRHKTKLQGEFENIKPPIYNGEAKEVTEALLININEYFQIYEYEDNLKARLAIH